MPAPGSTSPARRRRILINQARQAALAAPEAESPLRGECPFRGAVARLLEGPDPITWVFAGDSITHGALYTEGHRCFVEHFGERVRWELRRFDDMVLNAGVCGERTDGLLAALDRRVLRFRPEVVGLLLGMNDCLAGVRGREPFRRNLRELVGRIRQAGAFPVLQTPNLIYTPNATSRCDLPAYVQIIREESAQLETPLIDHWHDWCQTHPELGAVLRWLQDESIHPNLLGHRAMAQSLFRALGLFDSHSLTCTLPLE
jgi:acyl-CoA thioesterase I